jgi:hypothetical protein
LGPGLDSESQSSIWTGAPESRALSVSENAYFRGPIDAWAARSVINLQHTNSFDVENPWKHKNAAFADGFCLLGFLKMALVLVRRTSAMAMGTCGR